MSYYFKMYFKKVNSLDEAVETLNDYIDEYSSAGNLEKVVEENYQYILQEMKLIGVEKLNKKLDRINFWKHFTLFKYLFQSSLSFQALYYPEFKLLGLCYCSSSDIVDKYFDDMICFQNGCDQNYDYGIWKVLGSYFTNKSKEYEKLSAEELIKIFDYLDESDFEFKDDETKEHRLDYFRKSAMYKFVWDTLDLENWLCDKESNENTFIPLNLCVPLYGNNDSIVYTMLMKTFEMYKEMKKEERL